MKIIFALLISLICGIGVYSQTNPRPRTVNRNQQIIISDSVRYEIVSLNDMTVRLDRYTGKTYFYSFSTGKLKWFLLEVNGGLPTSSNNTMPKYEIYTVEDNSFLINNETGQSWVLNQRTWQPITD